MKKLSFLFLLLVLSIFTTGCNASAGKEYEKAMTKVVEEYYQENIKDKVVMGIPITHEVTFDVLKTTGANLDALAECDDKSYSLIKETEIKDGKVTKYEIVNYLVCKNYKSKTFDELEKTK